ncbi:hypothetical protein BGX29_008552 [Mortierella sp. GBA35]|nr:hypothetical protein BGX29_008552 [Mortierella sp. GBA35]
MKTTTSGRAFAKNIFDLFSTLMISLPIINHKTLFKSYPNSFTAEDAISQLAGLHFIQSNHDADPNDPTRIITRTVRTHFSLPRDMAKNLCQTFMDAGLFESASDPGKREFQNRGVYQVTGKGAHIVEKFVHRNGLPVDATRHITSNATPRIMVLERAEDEDAIVLNQKAVDAIFKRFAGLRPNIVSDGSIDSASSPGRDRDRVQANIDRCNGIEVKDQQHNYDMYKNTFYGRSAVEWLLDFTTVISKEESICIAQEFVTCRYIEQVGEEHRNGPALFRTGNAALYQFTEAGRAVLGWESQARSRGSSVNTDWMEERGARGARMETALQSEMLLSTQFKLTAHNIRRLPISVTSERRRSMDESSLGGSTQFNDDTTLVNGSVRRLSQILNDPTFQITLSESGGPMSSYAASSSGRESVGHREGGSTGSANGGTVAALGSSVQSSTSNVKRLELILDDSELHELFRNFLRANICEENLTFHLEVMSYKKRFEALVHSTRLYAQSLSAQDPSSVGPVPHPASLRDLEKQICTQAFAIYETYLIAGAPRELNLPHQMRLDLTAYMQAVVQNMETPSSVSAVTETPTLQSTQLEAGLIGAATGDRAKVPTKELIHIGLFDRADEHIKRLMASDSVPKFTKSEIYLAVIVSRMKLRNGNSSSGGGGGGNGSLSVASGKSLRSPVHGVRNHLSCDLEDTVLTVKKILSKRRGVPLAQLLLQHRGRLLNEDDTLKSHGIKKTSKLSVSTRMRGGLSVTMVAPGKFADVSDSLSIRTFGLTRGRPPGLTVRPRCQRRGQVPLHSKEVICPVHFGIIGLGKEKFRRPNCEKDDQAVPVTVGFRLCKHHLHGLKTDGTQFTGEWTSFHKED